MARARLDWSLYESDGSKKNWPTNKAYTKTTHPSWLNKVEETINKLPEIKDLGGPFEFSDWPTGYALFSKPRSGDNSLDYYVYGHQKSSFDSVNKALDHIYAILTSTLDHCECFLCNPAAYKANHAAKYRVVDRASNGKPYRAPNTQPAQPAQSAKPVVNQPTPFTTINAQPVTSQPAANTTSAMDPNLVQSPPVSTGVDEDGTPNVFDQLMARAYAGEKIKEKIKEPKSIEWLLEREVAMMPDYLAELALHARWMPRVGEIVLVARDVKDSECIQYDPSAGLFKIFDAVFKFMGMPKWEAAVVTQLPQGGAGLVVSSLSVDAESNPVSNGIRVEPMPEIGSATKGWSSRYAHVHLQDVRPFQFWQELLGLQGVDPSRANLHPTIRHALTCMSSLSVVDRHEFQSDPGAREVRIYCRGAFIGAEFVVEGDFVRFDSGQHANGTNAFKVRNMYLSCRTDRKPPSYVLHVVGWAYTTDPKQACGQSQLPIPLDKLPAYDIAGYGNWYYMHDEATVSTLALNQVKGRLLEDQYAKVLFSPAAIACVAPGIGAHSIGLPDHVVDITYGTEGIDVGRDYSTKNDARMGEGQLWFLAEDRAEQLDLHQINGQDVGDKARYGTEIPQPLQEEHSKAMFRARAARQKGVKGASGDATPPLDQLFLSKSLLASDINSLDEASARRINQGLDREEQYLNDMDEGIAQVKEVLNRGQGAVDMDEYID